DRGAVRIPVEATLHRLVVPRRGRDRRDLDVADADRDRVADLRTGDGDRLRDLVAAADRGRNHRPPAPGRRVDDDVAAVRHRAEHRLLRTERAVGEGVDEDGAASLGGRDVDGHGRVLLRDRGRRSAAGDGGEQGELVAVAQRVRALRVDTGDDGQRRVQGARDLRLVRGEAIAGVGDRRALVELERVQRRGGEAGEPGAEADADLHTARAYAAPGRFATSAQRVLADVVDEG